MNAKKIQTSFKKLYGKIKSAKDISEEDLRVAFVKSGILEELGYEGELKDIRFERGVRGKRSDLLAFDEYMNVVFVVEFKKPTEVESNLFPCFLTIYFKSGEGIGNPEGGF